MTYLIISLRPAVEVNGQLEALKVVIYYFGHTPVVY